jgi:hypothetical protein
MLIYFDIDGVVCKTKDGDYYNAVPIKSRIKKINEVYKHHTVIFYSARGAVTGIDYSDLTREQFEAWGLKYHGIFLSKPPWDLFVDDKAMSDIEYFRNI